VLRREKLFQYFYTTILKTSSNMSVAAHYIEENDATFHVAKIQVMLKICKLLDKPFK